MAKLIGVVSKVLGQVFAVANDGTRRALVEGDRLFAGEQLETGATGAVAVHLQNGAELTLGRESSLHLSSDLLAKSAPPAVNTDAAPPSQDQLTDVEQIQKAIAAGGDPTQEAEATAAGPGGNGSAAGGGHNVVMLSEVGGRVDPVIGFPTAGLNGTADIPDRWVAENSHLPEQAAPPVVNNPVTLDGLAMEGGEVTVNEANLPDGSAKDPGTLTQVGTFTVKAPDGVFNLNVGGINVITGGVVSGVGQSITTSLGNTLTITGYDPATGVVSYYYTLAVTDTHPAGNGANTVSESIKVVASDANGDVTNGSLDINVVDDVPNAIDDTNAHVASENLTTLTGNVFSNDVQGADRLANPITPGTYIGTYGTLKLAADGSYTYTLNSADPDFLALQGGAKGAETFTYTLRDADGDTSTADLVLQVHNNNDPVIIKGLNVACGELTVNEQNLCNGSDPDAAALTQSGTFTVTAADGLQSLTVGGINVISGGVAQGFPQSIQTGLGNTLTITGYNPTTGVVSYSYTLLDNEKHPNGHGSNTLSEHFNVVATDTDGSSASGKLDVNIVDDLPKARADWAEVDEGQSISGNVLHNDTLGADDPGCNVVIGVRAGGNTSTHASGSLNTEVHGKYGTLTLDAQGNATYHANPDAVGVAGAKDVFTYTIRDADGDKSTTTITIDVQNTCFDDRPQVISSERSVTANQVDSNLLLIIDVSGSMADDSGVRDLSRLELAKETIGLLLDKYEGMGDVKVQIVTFSTHAQEQSSVWVSVADAKNIISDLEAYGDTNYDAAVDAGQDAFDTAGKIAGAQNIGYFFSDGIPTSGHAIGTKDEAQWKKFLEANDIKSYAIGLGEGSDSGKLNPLAYDGSTGTNTDSTVVTDLNALGQVLSGTVQGSPITGSLMSGGTFGADGGFIKSLIIDGTTYTYDPKGNGNTGSYSATGGIDKGAFDTSTNTFNVKSSSGGSLQVDMDTGEFTYTPPKATGSAIKETFGFVASDNDGDLDSAQLVINVNANAAPVAGADHIITNLLSSQISVPAEALLANDSDANGDPLSATPTTFTTGWEAKGADLSVGNNKPTIGFNGLGSTSSQLFKDLDRSDFKGPAGSMAAALIVSGYLGQVGATNGEDYITVDLAKGERLALSHDRGDKISMAWKLADGSYHTIASGSDFLAEEGGRYTIHVSNVSNPIGNTNNAEAYRLTMTIDYSGADNTPDAHGTYSVSDGHNGSAVGDVTISYQAGNSLTGTAGADTLLAGNGDDILDGGDGKDVLSGGEGNDQLHGGNNDDLLIGGAGNDLIDGGDGSDTASYANAGSAVSVNLSLAGQQNTIGAGLDTLLSVENLMGSSHNDTLTGNGSNNVINGGLGNDILDGLGADDLLIGGRGDDTLTGGAGSDVFQWQPGNSGHDRVTDFTPGTDRLDLSQLLQGENASSASLDDYLHFKVTGTGSDVVSTIEVSAVAGASPTQTIDLAGVNLAAQYGVTAGTGGVVAAGADTATIINGMLNDHTLKVDTV
ncbi:retention module-containing protein [Pseudomonas sp. LS1212]|uniref:retention module-containing protein n=1 Tax=Pseudomonas sp. LS1212 TaxID=2972478 RepID=UPI00215BB893|nr:retention module-containing protein [Pseudomonas sp. LS1212]UVJ45320.1 retention module-containing protein [Pseudomonas sp. LS1212]